MFRLSHIKFRVLVVGLVAAGSALLGTPMASQPSSAAGIEIAPASASAPSYPLGASGSFMSPVASVPPMSSAIVPGTVDRTSAAVEVGYDVDVWVGSTRQVKANLRLDVQNTSGGPIDHLEMETAANVPLHVTAATVDGQPVTTTTGPSRLRVGLGGVLPDQASATVVLHLVIPLGQALDGDAWFHAYRDGIIQISQWLPRVGPGFSDVITAQVHGPAGMTVGVGPLSNVRQMPIVASRRYAELDGTAAGVNIKVLYLSGPAGHAVARAAIQDAKEVLPWIAHRLGPQPRTSITIAQVNSTGWAYTWPGIVWLPDSLKASEVRTYLAHELGHQWFGGIAVTDDPRAHPFAAEGPVELMARLFTHRLRPSLCPGRRLDLPKAAYGSCFYEAIYVDGANLLDKVRQRMGNGVYWSALRGYLHDHRFDVVTTQDLLVALEGASPVDLRPLLRGRFAHY